MTAHYYILYPAIIFAGVGAWISLRLAEKLQVDGFHNEDGSGLKGLHSTCVHLKVALPARSVTCCFLYRVRSC